MSEAQRSLDRGHHIKLLSALSCLCFELLMLLVIKQLLKCREATSCSPTKCLRFEKKQEAARGSLQNLHNLSASDPSPPKPNLYHNHLFAIYFSPNTTLIPTQSFKLPTYPSTPDKIHDTRPLLPWPQHFTYRPYQTPRQVSNYSWAEL